MAATVPDSLKSADIQRFATRAYQVEKAKPAVAYWCTYWIVQQIVTKGLHNSDDESRKYTSELMDKLEAMKSINDDAINDEVAGQALVEQFGLEVFTRADNAVRANKASKQTADNFQASYTFLELLQIWPPVDPEITSKVKYAKYHAVRIAKAIKAGEDPNKSNPAPPEPTQNQAAPQLDPNDPEVRALQGQSPAPQQPPAGFHQPSIEDVPDEHDRIAPSLAQASTLNQSLHPSRDSSIPRPAPDYPPATVPAPSDPAENFYQTSAAPANGEVSPLGPPSTAAPPSVGGSYFPRIPDDPHAEPKSEEPLLPSAPSNIPQSPPDVAPISPPGTQPSAPPPNFASLPPSAAQPYPPQPPIQSPNVQSPIQPPHQAPSQNLPFGYQNYGTVPTSQPRPPPSAQHPPPQQQYTGHWHQPQPGPPPQSTPYQPQQPPQPQDTVVDEEAITKAQKHARWAISALNFEDVPTAIKELRGALETLGAR